MPITHTQFDKHKSQKLKNKIILNNKNGGQVSTALLYSSFQVGHCNECVKFELIDIKSLDTINDSERRPSCQPSILSIFYDNITIKVIYFTRY